MLRLHPITRTLLNSEEKEKKLFSEKRLGVNLNIKVAVLVQFLNFQPNED